MCIRDRSRDVNKDNIKRKDLPDAYRTLTLDQLNNKLALIIDPRTRDNLKQNDKTVEDTIEEGLSLSFISAKQNKIDLERQKACLLYTSPSPRDLSTSRMPSSA
eukprot:TRINITY_DN27870_c0_g1_i1.p2 TRINITY_DN27870_c0_g1~~TRINITY_DN27870_c0_g1_i1.p2  ORF type:complete len:104 (-),score=24.27 TRINITY_DN27870_c0_g1_i1:91-402(-)